MALTLPCVPDTLDAVLRDKSINNQLKQDLISVKNDAVKCAENFRNSFQKNGRELYHQYKLVKKAKTPEDINVNALQDVLKVTQISFTSSKTEIFLVQTKVHSQYENCRGEIKTHNEERDDHNWEVKMKKAEIPRLKELIRVNERESQDLDKDAQKLSDRADELKKIEQNKKDAGVGSFVVSSLVGAVLAPFTGGASLLFGATAGAIIGGINLAQAEDCRNGAESCRQSACNKREHARNLRSDMRKLETRIIVLEVEIVRLEKRIGELEETARALKDMESFLQSYVVGSDNVLNIIQEIGDRVRDTMLKAPTFSLARDSKREAIVNKQMKKLMESIEELQDIMSRYGAVPTHGKITAILYEKLPFKAKNRWCLVLAFIVGFIICVSVGLFNLGILIISYCFVRGRKYTGICLSFILVLLWFWEIV